MAKDYVMAKEYARMIGKDYASMSNSELAVALRVDMRERMDAAKAEGDMAEYQRQADALAGFQAERQSHAIPASWIRGW